MKNFPAVVIGGPPHSGKSVLTYSLTQALRDRKIDHYVLRACPDGEGDWSNEADAGVVRLIRDKGQFTDSFVAHVCENLANRHLPLLVDVGGRPTREQEIIFDHCTHAVLLSSDPVLLAQWRDLVEDHGLIVVAELHSQLHGEARIDSEDALLSGVLTGLERHTNAQGPLFDRLTDRLANLLTVEDTDLRKTHAQLCPIDMVVELDRLAIPLGLPADTKQWKAEHLPLILDYLPAHTALALYGRGPNWVYAALAVHTQPAALYQFDPRLGWVHPPSIQFSAKPVKDLLTWQFIERDTHLRLEFTLPHSYLDYSEAVQLHIPPLISDSGLVISGKLPFWLLTAVVRLYSERVPWLACYYPPVNDKAVVICSHTSDYAVGDLVPSQAC